MASYYIPGEEFSWQKSASLLFDSSVFDPHSPSYSVGSGTNWGMILQTSHWFIFVISVESIDDLNPGKWQAKDRGWDGVGRFQREMVADLFGKRV